MDHRKKEQTNGNEASWYSLYDRDGWTQHFVASCDDMDITDMVDVLESVYITTGNYYYIPINYALISNP